MHLTCDWLIVGKRENHDSESQPAYSHCIHDRACQLAHVEDPVMHISATSQEVGEYRDKIGAVVDGDCSPE